MELCYDYNHAVHSPTGTTSFDPRVESPEFPIIQYDRRAPKESIKEDFNKCMEVAICKARTSLEVILAKYKENFDKHVMRTHMLRAGESVYLDINGDAKEREELLHQISGPFRIVKVSKINKLVIKSGEDVDRLG